VLHVLVLGAAAGGGFPQWNCNDDANRRARADDPAVRPRTQSSIAVSADGKRWVILNASPDLRQQINDNQALHPALGDPPRASPIAAVVVTNADVDHVTGLLNLRESQPFVLYGHERVLGVLAKNSIFNVLNPAYVDRRPLPLDTPLELTAKDGAPLGVTVTSFVVPGKIALWLEDLNAPGFGSQAGDTIGLRITGSDGADPIFYIPGCASMPPELAARLKGAALVFFDGTLWRDDEMIAAGVGVKTGQRMGHMSVSGPAGVIAAFTELGVRRKVLIHINNSNPLLIDTSPELAEARAAGWDVAFDGMEITV
jgi:pyrroloquinoline quinone biosynthesis protein B